VEEPEYQYTTAIKCYFCPKIEHVPTKIEDSKLKMSDEHVFVKLPQEHSGNKEMWLCPKCVKLYPSDREIAKSSKSLVDAVAATDYAQHSRQPEVGGRY
jgi:hypothetical protein